MNKYKLLCLDMDGTTLTSEHEFPDETTAAIDEIRKMGVKVSLATGRGLAELQDYRPQQDHLDYGIIDSGGVVYDFAARKPLFAKAFDPDTALRVIDVGATARAMVHILTVDTAYALADDIAHMSRFSMETYQPMYERGCIGVAGLEDLRDIVRNTPDDVIKINLYHRTVEERETTREKLKDLPLSYVYAEQTSYEASPPGINKAAGLAFLCQHLGISAQEVIAIGDAPNDVEILQTAGLSIAMGNATEQIKALADDVTLTCDENGVLAAIKKYFLT